MPRPTRHDASPHTRRGSEQRHPRRTFGVGFFWYLLLGLVVFWVVLLVKLAESLEVDRLLLLLAGILLGSVACFTGWRRYRLDADGVAVQSLSRRFSWTWDEIGGVSGTRVDQGALRGHTRATMVRYDIRNADGWLLFRISPWIGRRKALAGEIRRRAAEARRAGGA